MVKNLRLATPYGVPDLKEATDVQKEFFCTDCGFISPFNYNQLMHLRKTLALCMILILPSQSFAGSFGDIFGRVLGEVIFRSLFHVAFDTSIETNHRIKTGHSNAMSMSSNSSRRTPRPRALTLEGKKVNFLFSVKFVLDPDEVKNCSLQKTVHHRSFFPWIVDYPKKQYMYLWYNNQSLKEKAKKNLANVVLIKGQKKNPLRVKQEADLYSCPKLKPIAMNGCKWIKTERIKINDRAHASNKQATVKMMNKTAELGGNHIAFINRTGKSAMGMQRFKYEVFNCK